MIEDASSFPPGHTLSADLCIIGAGAAGITLAHSLRKSGKSIVLLEGSYLDQPQRLAADYKEKLMRFGSPPETKHRFEDPLAQTLYKGNVSAEMAAIDEDFLTRSRIRVYGGTTNCWGGWTRTLTAADFDRSDLDRRKMIWPFKLDTLLPYYRRALYYCSLGDFDPAAYDDPHAWVDKAVVTLKVLPHDADSLMRSVVWTVMNGHGPVTPDGAWDFQKVWGPDFDEEPKTVTLVRNANVRSIKTSAGSVTHITGNAISYATGKAGNEFTVSAKNYVLAMGGIETVRLLLLSKLPFDSTYLGNHFMIHPLNIEAVTFRGPSPDPEIVDFYARETQLRGDQFAPSIFAAMTPTPAALHSRIGNIRAIVRFNGFNGGTIDLNWEQAPNSNNAIRLSTDPTDVDLFGDPRVFLDWRMNQLDKDTVQIGGNMAIDELRRLGLLTSVDKHDLRVTWPGDHHMGGTRMAESSNDGYVDPNCRVWSLSNLYIASSSVFPTSGFANPTLTIIALAIRLGDFLRSH